MSKHTRYREIPVEENDLFCPQRKEPVLKIILFINDGKLRSHTVKHLADMNELGNVWEKILPRDRSLVTQCINNLQHMGCPFAEKISSKPLCDKECIHFEKCGVIISETEELYVNAIEEIIKKGVSVPRYACLFSDNNNTYQFWLMPDQPFIVKASLLGERDTYTDTYNLMTCYGSKDRSFTEMRYYQMLAMKDEARTKNIQLLNHDTWGWRAPGKKSGKAAKKSHNNEERGKKRRPYKRKSGNFRDFFDEL